jgi:hypothetical protein
LIVIVATGLGEFKGGLPLSDPGVLDLHAVSFGELLLLHGFACFSLLFLLLHEKVVGWSVLSFFLPLLLLRLFLLARLRIIRGKMAA